MNGFKRLLASRVLILLLLLGAGAVGQAVDFGAWARHVRHYGDWTALDFRDPGTGLFLAARAATEDSVHDATLTLTAAPAAACQVEAVIVVKGEAPAEHDGVTEVQVQVASDAGLRRNWPARLVTVSGDFFFFVELVAAPPWERFPAQSSLTVAWGTYRLRFSTVGLAAALAAARDTCHSFLPQP